MSTDRYIRSAADDTVAERLARETDVLAKMMGADSQRIDAIVQDVGQVKGDVRSLVGDVGRVVQGVDELRGALTDMARFQVRVEHSASETTLLRADVERIDRRVQGMEQQMPQLVETRAMVMRGVIGVVAVVLMAVLGLVIKRGM